MAPGIMILAASEPPTKLSAHGSIPSSPEIEYSESRRPRPESPGGYFTLSDSDGASCIGPDPSHDPDEPPKIVHHMYKIFRSPASTSLSESPPRSLTPKSETLLQRSRSETPPRRPAVTRDSSVRNSKTPPRPSPPKLTAARSRDEETPPRPPPPISYTSTLPPPVPKKLGRSSLNGQNGAVKRNETPSRYVSVVAPTPRSKPLQRVQPLQIQSPSVIKMLTSAGNMTSGQQSLSFSGEYSSSCSSSSGSEENAHSSIESGIGSRPELPKKKSPPRSTTATKRSKPLVTSSSADQTSGSSFLKTFQKATTTSSSSSRRSSNESLSSLSTSSAPKTSRKLTTAKDVKKVEPKSTTSTTTTMRVTKSNDVLTFSKTGRTDPTKQVLQRKSSSPELTSSRPANTGIRRSTSQASSFSQSKVIVRTLPNLRPSESQPLRPKTPSFVKKSSSCFGSSESESKEIQRPSIPGKCSPQRKLSDASLKSSSTSVRRALSNSSSFGEIGDKKRIEAARKAKATAQVVPSQKKPSLSESFAASEQIQKIKKAVTLTRANSSERSKVADDKHSESVQMRLKNSIHSLIKFYETSVTHKRPVVLEDKTLDEVLGTSDDGQSICTAGSGHLSQLSQLSVDRLHSWLSNPLPDSKDFSLIEVDVLDQYVTDMLSFTKGALSDVNTPRHSLQTCEISGDESKEPEEEGSKVSVQDMISRIEGKENKTIVVTSSDGPPSDEDLNRGVFTEVSFAGTFAPLKLQQQQQQQQQLQKQLNQLKQHQQSSHLQQQQQQLKQQQETVQPDKQPQPVLQRQQKLAQCAQQQHKPQAHQQLQQQQQQTQHVKQLSHKTQAQQQPKSSSSQGPSSAQEAKQVLELKKVEVKSTTEIPITAPVPSPRLKRKARKEQMLLEHKEKGKEALSQLVRSISQTPERDLPNQTFEIDTKPEPKDGREGSNVKQVEKGVTEAGVGIDSLLDDLCAHSAGVVRDIAEDRRSSKTGSAHSTLARQPKDRQPVSANTEQQKVG